jgi:predicted DCC family thiol-disulfide oxidoreductase YuxK
VKKHNKKTIKLYYDGDCPFCKKYAIFVDMRKKFDIQLINAREAKEDILDLHAK